MEHYNGFSQLQMMMLTIIIIIIIIIGSSSSSSTTSSSSSSSSSGSITIVFLSWVFSLSLLKKNISRIAWQKAEGIASVMYLHSK